MVVMVVMVEAYECLEVICFSTYLPAPLPPELDLAFYCQGSPATHPLISLFPVANRLRVNDCGRWGLPAPPAPRAV